MSDEDSAGGIQSLDAALRLLAAMAERPGAVALSDLARDLGMPPSKAHRYLASFQHAGLVVQAGRSGKYDLGPGAIRLGLAALARHDFVNRTADALPDLVAQTGLTALLSVWGSQGPTVVRWERAAVPTVTSMGLGTVLPLMASATGRAFLAWGPPAPMQGMLAEGAEGLAESLRSAGYASVDGRFIPGLVAIAAPILDWQGQAQAVVTLIGTDPALAAPDAPQVQVLTGFCRALGLS